MNLNIALETGRPDAGLAAAAGPWSSGSAARLRQAGRAPSPGPLPGLSPDASSPQALQARLRRRLVALPLAVMALLAALLAVNESMHQRSMAALTHLQFGGDAGLLGLAPQAGLHRDRLAPPRHFDLRAREPDARPAQPAPRKAAARPRAGRTARVSTLEFFGAAALQPAVPAWDSRFASADLRGIAPPVPDARPLQQALQLNRLGVGALAAAGLLALLLGLRQTARLAALERRQASALQSEHERLEVEVARRTRDLTELTRHLQSVREDERSRLARELHDELGALLTAAKLDAARLKRAIASGQAMTPDIERCLHCVNEHINNGIGLKRRIIEDLRPSSLGTLGLVAALEILADEHARRTEVPVHTELSPVRLGESAQITVYRLVQEALTNSAKYSCASVVRLSLGPDPGTPSGGVRLSVHDDGCGFDPGAAPPRAHGLMGMRYRVEAEGGSLRIRSMPGHGTCIEARLPAAQAAQPDGATAAAGAAARMAEECAR